MRPDDGEVRQKGSGPFCCADDVVVQRTKVNNDEEVVIVKEQYCGPLSIAAALLCGPIGCICFKNADERMVQFTRKFEKSKTGVLVPHVYRVELPGGAPAASPGQPQVAAPQPVTPMTATVPASEMTHNPLVAAAAPVAVAAPP